MSRDTDTEFDAGVPLASPFDTEPVAEEDLWFLPGSDADGAPTDPPWPVAPREGALDRTSWADAEAAQYRALLAAAQAVTRFGERLRAFPEPVAARFALASVTAVLRGEGAWLSAEQIALYRALRLASGDDARVLARGAWALRRLEAGAGSAAADPLDGLRRFLGREAVQGTAAAPLPGDDPRAAGDELDALSDQWSAAVAATSGLHPLTRAAHGFALWRSLGLTPWDEVLEPTVAAMLIGAAGSAPFVPMAPGHRLDRHAVQEGADAAGARVGQFYAAAEAGALAGCLELDRLAAWRRRATGATGDLSGRTPPAMIGAFLRLPILSAELVASETGCSRAAARRNLALFTERGLIRELTGQERYRFWTVSG